MIFSIIFRIASEANKYSASWLAIEVGLPRKVTYNYVTRSFLPPCIYSAVVYVLSDYRIFLLRTGWEVSGSSFNLTHAYQKWGL
jgi:hypothetical protein